MAMFLKGRGRVVMTTGEWCGSGAKSAAAVVFRELPDGSRAVEIKETPAIFCENCENPPMRKL